MKEKKNEKEENSIIISISSIDETSYSPNKNPPIWPKNNSKRHKKYKIEKNESHYTDYINNYKIIINNNKDFSIGIVTGEIKNNKVNSRKGKK